jgi:hypothetical protein
MSKPSGHPHHIFEPMTIAGLLARSSIQLQRRLHIEPLHVAGVLARRRFDKRKSNFSEFCFVEGLHGIRRTPPAR